MRLNSLNIMLLLVTTVNGYGIVRRQQHSEEREYLEKNPIDTEGEFSYVVDLQEWRKGENYVINIARICTGSAITKQWILTAGHCISKKLSHVEYGEKGNKNVSKIISKKLHPGYRMDYSFGGYYAILNNNIALIKVETMNLKKYARISARDYSTIIGEIVKYAGYGGLKLKNENNSSKEDGPKDQYQDRTKRQEETKEEKENRTPDELRVAQGGIIKCERERYIIFQPAMCFAPKCGRQKLRTSQADSGGPLTLDKRIIGVNSGYSPIMSDVFTPVSPFFDWITSTINKKKIDIKKNS